MNRLSDLNLVEEKMTALKRIEIFAQPIVNLKNKEDNKPHFEILSRFYDDLDNLIMPEGIFSGGRTDHELLTLDRIIFNDAFSVLNSLDGILGKNYLAAINVSEASVVGSGYFLTYVEELRKKYKLNSKNIQLEITERSDECIKPFVNRALEFGYSLSVDDFASKNFTIGKLKNQILDNRTEDELSRIKVKIDMQFILNLMDGKNKYYNSDRGVINLALSVKSDFPQIYVVAEGIEDLDTALYLRDFGVDFGQGYFWSKPKLFGSDYIQPILK